VHSASLSADGRYALSGSRDGTIKLWEVDSGRCSRTLTLENTATSVCLSADGRYALSGSLKTLKLWGLDWELEDKQPADWAEGARPHLETFLTLHTPYAGALPQDRSPTEEEITLALTRCGAPAWTEEDFQGLLYTVGCAGYGWLRPEGVRRELEEMARGRSAAAPKETSVPPVTVVAETVDVEKMAGGRSTAPQETPEPPKPGSKGSWLSKVLGKG
jgi:WD domain, G-beta repeat